SLSSLAWITGIGLTDNVVPRREYPGRPLGYTAGIQWLQRSGDRRSALIGIGDGARCRCWLVGRCGVLAHRLRVEEDFRPVWDRDAERKRIEIQVIGVPCPICLHQRGGLLAHRDDYGR